MIKNSSKKSKYKNQFGFTLVELLVSTSIIALLGSMIVVNYKSSNRNSAAMLAVQKIASDLRLAQGKSLGSEMVSGNSTVPSWGAFFATGDSGKYIIFSDLNENNAYDEGEKYKDITFPSGVTIYQILVNNVSNTTATIVFVPPNPKTYINQDALSSTRIIIKDQEGRQHSCLVNFFGLIDPI